MEQRNRAPDWVRGLPASITVCDRQGIILEMNEKAQNTFGAGLIGKSLFDCHSEKSGTILRELLKTGRTNAYTIEKKGIKKLIYQSPWYEPGDPSRQLAGLVEISIELPAEMPHFRRD